MIAKIKEYLFWKRQVKKIERCTEPVDVNHCIMQMNLKSAPRWFLKRAMRKINRLNEGSGLNVINLDLEYEIYKREKDDVIRGI